MGPIRLAVILCTLVFSSMVFAQEDPTNSTEVSVEDVQPQQQEQATEESSGGRVEKLEVTGSFIRRTDIEGPSPVVTIDRQQIEQSGMNDLSSIIQRSTASPFGGSGSTVNLKGLGSGRTLILINGQRAPGSGSSYASGAVSVDFVPVAAVERIEILKDGASATYGSDALGGVINIITRKNLDGFRFVNQYNLSNNIVGSDNNRASLAYGTQTAKSNFMTSLQLSYTEGYKTSSLDFARDLNKSIPFSTNYRADSGAYLPGPNCTLLNENGQCEERVSEHDEQEPSYDLDWVTDYSYSLSDDTTVYATLIAGYGRSQRNFPNILNTPGSGVGFTLTGAETPASWNTLPGYSGGDTRVFHRFDDYVNQSIDNEYHGALILGIKGYLGNTDWQWDVTTNNQVAIEESHDKNLATVSGAYAAITADTYNPFDTTKRNTTGLGIDAFNRNTSVVNWFEAKTNGTLISSTGFDLQGAFGASMAHFQYRDHRNADILRGNVMLQSGTAGQGERQLYSVFSELGANIFNKVEVQQSLRGDFYSDFGQTLNPKFAVRYQPLQWLTLRTSVGTGFQAPTLQNMNARIEGYDFLVDQVRCKDPSIGNGDPSSSDCGTKTMSVFQNTNQDLKEETSLSLNFGTIIQPTKNFSVAIDFWYVKVEDTIGAELNDILLLEQMDPTAPGRYGVNIIRDGGATGPIDRIEYTLFNVGTEQADGIDLDIQYRLNTSIGDFTFQNETTYMGHYYTEFYSELGKQQVLGQFGKPRWRNNLTLAYERGQFRFQAVARSFADMEKRVRGLGKVSSPTQLDANITYDPTWAGEFQLGGINLFNVRPDFDDTYSSKVNGSVFRRTETIYFTYRQDF